MKNLAIAILNEISSGNPGGTFDVHGSPVKFDKGYMVGTISRVLNEISEFEIHCSLLEIKEDTQSEPLFYGFWKNDGEIYLDSVMCVTDLARAKTIGKLCSQIAIWDCANQTEILL